jgi:prepilin-type N-terminal cleavage/methylation domain-containing protein
MMNFRQSQAPCGRSGFTLMEMIFAMAIFVIVIAGVFAIANGAMELSSDLTQTQERSMIRQNFIDFLRNSFRRLPGDAEITLAVENQRGTYVPTMTVYNGAEAFSPGPSLPPDESVELFAQETPGGYLRVGLRLLDDKQTNALRSGSKRRPPINKDDRVLPLIEKVGAFEWEFLNPATGKWENNWKPPQRPLFARLSFKLDDGVPTTSVFWIPPIVKRAPNGVGIPGPTPSLGPDGKPLPPGTTPPPTGDPNGNPNVVPPPTPSK